MIHFMKSCLLIPSTAKVVLFVYHSCYPSSYWKGGGGGEVAVQQANGNLFSLVITLLFVVICRYSLEHCKSLHGCHVDKSFRLWCHQMGKNSNQPTVELKIPNSTRTMQVNPSQICLSESIM